MRRPRIGLDLDHEHDGRRWVHKVPVSYLEALVRAGAEPVLLCSDDPREPEEILEGLDGFLCTGGDDFHPRLMGRLPEDFPMTLLSVKRERFVRRMGRALFAARLPCLAVCLGFQTLTLEGGGALWIDLPSEVGGEVDHAAGAEHRIDPEPGGWLHRWWEGRSQVLMSHHHQGLRDLGPGFAVEARAEDGIVEAWRVVDHPFLLGLQWHPEVQLDHPGGLPIVQRLVEAARGQG